MFRVAGGDGAPPPFRITWIFLWPLRGLPKSLQGYPGRFRGAARAPKELPEQPEAPPEGLR